MSLLRDTAEAARLVSLMARGVWPSNALGEEAVKAYQRALAAVGLYDPGDDDEWIDGDAGWMTRFAHAQAIAAVRGIGTWAYDDLIPREDKADEWAAMCAGLGLDGVILMLSSARDAHAGIWRLEHDAARYIAATQAARRHGLRVAFMPWVAPRRKFIEDMIGDVLDLCEAAEVYDVHVDAEGAWRVSGDTDHHTLARRVVAEFAAAGVRTGVSGYPAMAVAGGMDRPGVECLGRDCDDDNDTIDPWVDAIVEAGAIDGRVGAVSPQCYSQYDAEHASDVYLPGNTQTYAAVRWNLTELGERAELWMALAAYRQHSRPKWSTLRHMAVAYTKAVELGAEQIPYWSRWWISQGSPPEVRAFVAGVAERRRHFLDLARAA